MGLFSSVEKYSREESCSFEDDRVGACEMGKCVEFVKGLASNSASNTDTWLIKFKDDASIIDLLGNTVEKKCAFMKLYLSRETVRGVRIPENLRHRMENTAAGLDYEKRIFSEIIAPMYSEGICTFFPKVIGTGDSCTMSQLLNIVNGSTLRLGPGLTRVISKQDEPPDLNDLSRRMLYRNFAYLLGIHRLNSTRPALGELSRGNPREFTAEDVHELRGDLSWFFHPFVNMQDVKILAESTKISFVLTEQSSIEGEIKNFCDLLVSTVDPRSDQLWSVIFQVVVGIYAMGLKGLMHNDLHLKNILLESADPTEPSWCLVDGVSYTFFTKFTPVIIDFDRSYVAGFGPNESALERFSQTNSYAPIRDVVKFFGEIVRSLYKRNRKNPTLAAFSEEISNTLARLVVTKDHEDFRKYLLEVWKASEFLLDNNGRPLQFPTENFAREGVTIESIPGDPQLGESLKSVSQIVHEIGSLIRKESVIATNEPLANV